MLLFCTLCYALHFYEFIILTTQLYGYCGIKLFKEQKSRYYSLPSVHCNYTRGSDYKESYTTGISLVAGFNCNKNDLISCVVLSNLFETFNDGVSHLAPIPENGIPIIFINFTYQLTV